MEDIQVSILQHTPKQATLSAAEKRKLKKDGYLQRKEQKLQNKLRFTQRARDRKQDYEQPVEEVAPEAEETDHPKEARDRRQRPQAPERPQYELPAKPTEKTDLFTSGRFETMEFISPQVKKALAEANYTVPTQIQSMAMGKIFEKSNAIVRSVTGSGKTLSYLIPLYSRLSSSGTQIKREDGTLILIVCPTRELAIQCIDVASKCGKRCPFLVYGGLLGGENPKKEKARLRKGVSVLMGTPGRIAYHLKNTQSFMFSKLQALVFEEWDRLLDMGFQKNIDEIVQIVQERCNFEEVQKILVSAHVSPNFAVIPSLNINPSTYAMIGFDSGEIVTAHRKHKADHADWFGEEVFSVPKTLSQFYTFVQDVQKVPFLLAYVMAQRGKKAIIFVATCDEVEYFAALCHNVCVEDKPIFGEFAVLKLHGNIEQKQRSATYFEFRKATENAILISTQVASRGLDFPDVANIMLFDPPDGKDDYINKVGRTARIDQNGSSLLVLCENPNTTEFINNLQKDLTLEYAHCNNYFRDFQAYIKQTYDIDERKGDLYLLQAIRRFVRPERENQLMARRYHFIFEVSAYISFIRAYTRLQELKVKSMNLHELSKSFGLERAISADTKDQKYQKELFKTNREKFRNQGVELNSLVWEQVRKKRRVVTERELNKMEFN